ncbi:MAG: co-chaperone GroES [Candidatus Aminicenantes bacterium]|nr:co-chaperone GroES [Acidobacteriota bacterium]MCG2811348.1 co-chaperone GroES [Candidatus Aminicenantes bacterium]
MNLQPLDDRVLVEPIEEEEKVGSLVIPDTAKEKPMMGFIRAIGYDAELEGRKPMKEILKVGDKVLFGKYSGQEIKIGGKKHLVIERKDLLAIVK